MFPPAPILNTQKGCAEELGDLWLLNPYGIYYNGTFFLDSGDKISDNKNTIGAPKSIGVFNSIYVS